MKLAVVLVICAVIGMLAAAGASATSQNLAWDWGSPSEAPPVSNFWCRDGQGSARWLKLAGVGKTLEIQHSGEQDWSFPLASSVAVKPFDQFRMAVDIRILERTDGHVVLSCIAYDAAGKALNWSYAPLEADYSRDDWQHLEGHFVVPKSFAQIEFRLMGSKKLKFQAANPLLEKEANALPDFNTHELPLVELQNAALHVVVNPRNWSFAATLAGSGIRWQSFPCQNNLVITKVEKQGPLQATFEALLIPAGAFKEAKLKPCQLEIALDAKMPAFSVKTSLAADFAFDGALQTVPALCQNAAGSEVVLPVNEGMLYKCDGKDLPQYDLVLYGGHGLCMPWFGITQPEAHAAAMCWTLDADDATARPAYLKEKALSGGTTRLLWHSQKGRWGYDRTAHFWFAASGGYVALARRYRQVAEAAHKVVTLAEKERKLPQLSKLLGAPDLWLLGDQTWQERLECLKWLHERGVDHLLHSNAIIPEEIDAANKLGYLTSCYDIYQDTWDPEDLERAGVHNRTQGFPDDVIVRKDGTLQHGWVIRTEKGEVPGYVICGTQHLKWAEKRIPKVLETKHYGARFIDTTTAAQLQECYSPDHPCTRTGEKEGKSALLKYVGDEGLVCGSETGIDWAVPVVCYFEGMLSIGPYRHPEAGYLSAGKEPNPETLEHQLNPAVRAPLWELVYHDCVVNTWYWGDGNSQFPSLWHKRDLFNALYAQPPLFMVLNKQAWLEQREGIVETYKFLKPVFDAVGFAQMVDHRFLSEDRLLQLSEFSNGVGVVVNFSDQPRHYKGFTIKPESYRLLQRKDN